MLETPGKAIARNHLYRGFLPAVLPESQIGSGEFLVLLGETDYEIALLDELGVSRHQVYSVERDPAVMKAQAARYGSAVNLYMGELADFIQQNLDSNRRFLVLNLDIYGSYLNAIDPALSTILLFARRNPQTAVATYSNAGRDREQLFEGIKSLLLFLRYLPEATHALVSRLMAFYRQTGMSETVAWNMVLRHCFWVRSHMEHIAASSHAVGRSSSEDISAMLHDHDVAWQKAVRKMPKPLRYFALQHLASSLPAPAGQAAVLDMGLSRLQLLTYAASSGFYHNCYYTLYSSLPRLVTPAEWLEAILVKFVETPPIYIDADGERFHETSSGTEPGLAAVLARQIDPGFKSRRVAIPPMSEMLAMNVVELGASFPLDRRTIAKICQLAESGMKTKEMMQYLPPGTDPKRVTAHLATYNRMSGKSRR